MLLFLFCYADFPSPSLLVSLTICEQKNMLNQERYKEQADVGMDFFFFSYELGFLIPSQIIGSLAQNHVHRLEVALQTVRQESFPDVPGDA